jgi:hypothetical protein
MAHLYTTLIALLVSSSVVVAQPFTQNELAWPASLNPYNNTACFAGATNGVINIPKNSSRIAVYSQGSSGTYALLTSPVNGTLGGFNTHNGITSYQPTVSFVGSDLYQFTVTSGSCVATGTVYIAVFDTNSASPSFTCLQVTNVAYVTSGADPDSGQTICETYTINGQNDTICYTNTTKLPSGGGGSTNGQTGNYCVTLENICGSLATVFTTNGYAVIFKGTSTPTFGSIGISTNANYAYITNTILNKQNTYINNTNTLTYTQSSQCYTNLTIQGTITYTYNNRFLSSFDLSINGSSIVSLGSALSPYGRFPWVTNFTRTYTLTTGSPNIYSLVLTNGLGNLGGDTINTDNPDTIFLQVTNILQ